MANRTKQLKESSVKTDRADLMSANFGSNVLLFSDLDNRLIGWYSASALSNITTVPANVELLTELEEWSVSYPEFSLLLSRTHSCVNDRDYFVLNNGKYRATDFSIMSRIQGDFTSSSAVSRSISYKHLVKRVELALLLAHFDIIEMTETVLCNIDNQHRIQAAAQQQRIHPLMIQNHHNPYLPNTQGNVYRP